MDIKWDHLAKQCFQRFKESDEPSEVEKQNK